jgi:hypothetical protein
MAGIGQSWRTVCRVLLFITSSRGTPVVVVVVVLIAVAAAVACVVPVLVFQGVN